MTFVKKSPKGRLKEQEKWERIFAERMTAWDRRGAQEAIKKLEAIPEARESFFEAVLLYANHYEDVEMGSLWLDIWKREFPESRRHTELLMGYLLIAGQYQRLIEEGEAYIASPHFQDGDKPQIFHYMAKAWRSLGDHEQGTAYALFAYASTDNVVYKRTLFSNYLFGRHYFRWQDHPELPPASKYSKLYADVVPYTHRRGKRRRDKIRVGYISPDLRSHIVMRFAEVLFRDYDRASFEVYAYMVKTEDETSRLIEAQVTRWRALAGRSDAEMARIIREDDLDILVDLAGHSTGNALGVLAYRPAPVQISGIGYFDSTGLDAVDYFLSDTYVSGQPSGIGKDTDFTEKMLILSGSHLCYTPWEDAAKVPEYFLPPVRRKGYITFGCFNNWAKVTDEMLTVWKQILDRMPGSHLFLKGKRFDTPEGCLEAQERLTAVGFDPARLDYQGFTDGVYSAYGEVDVALDTSPYPGGGTTFDALYMGVPLVVYAGDKHGERFGRSIMMNLGLSELIAADDADYVEKTVALASDEELLTILHKNLRQMMMKTPLLDGKAYMRDLEAAYRLVLRCEED
ncbi:hypothetical protein TAMA11512_22240 [Selenomonas sp. TAMA-11512]|uniref:O-linked N-acetylglucosamine transferase, SPINDLY family protein n=1 Tax=Selenomonas sp. TAMA-11512 TaxID=3095337 RepID=UPI00308756FD|nr:hypothetical protein TAMA11512_22240 [Selenomonas sp. TAMA-11512]